MVQTQVMSFEEFFAKEKAILPTIEDVKRVNVLNPKLKALAITLWTVSGSLIMRPNAYAADGTSFWTEMQPLFQVFQEMALGIGALAIIAGLVLLGFKKRWGQVTLRTTVFIIAGVFLVPSVLMILAIVATYLNDALYEALNNIREAKAMKG